MQAIQNSFLHFLNGEKQFTIPIYQRTYSWTSEQCEQLWNDIIHTGSNDKVTGHFIDSIVYIQHGLYQTANVTQLQVIDGQQRLTTLTLLLIALANVAQNAGTALRFKRDQIYDNYLINKYSQESQYYKLLLTQSDKDTLTQLVDDAERAKAEINTNRLLENYRYFENLLQQDDIDLNTIYTGVSKLVIVD